ncbi:hypothetical protein HK098_002239, partial [Nowakowskiella sp. JEL0407]
MYSSKRENNSGSDPHLHSYTTPQPSHQLQFIQQLLDNYTLHQSPLRNSNSPILKNRPSSPTSQRRSSMSTSRQNSNNNLLDSPFRLQSSVHPPIEDLDLLNEYIKDDPSNLLQALPAIGGYLEEFTLSNPQQCLPVWNSLFSLLKQIQTWKLEESKSKSSNDKNKQNSAQIKPPSCDPKPKKWVNVHGEEWEDGFAWLNERENKEVLEYIEEENKYSREIMKETKPLQKMLYKEFVSRLDENEESAKVLLPDGYIYYSRKVPGEEYRVHCRLGEIGIEEIYLDENKLANSEDYEDASFFRVGFLKHSPDCKLIAYGVDSMGNERNTVYFMNLDTKEMLQDKIEGVYEDFEFSMDSSRVFYTLLDEGERAYQAKRHVIGTSVDTDELLYHEEDEMFYLSLSKTGNGKYILINTKAQITSETRYISAENHSEPIQLLLPRRENIQYSCEQKDDYFYVLSNEDSKNNWLYRIPVPTELPLSPESIEELIAQRETVIEPRDFVLIEDFHLRKNHLIVIERSNCLQNVRVVDLRVPGFSAYHYISFSDAVYSLWPGSVNEEVADLTKFSQYDTSLFRFTYTSFTQPKQVIDYDMDLRTTDVVHEENVNGVYPYDPSIYTSKRLYATGVDGTTVPVSLVYRRDLLGANLPNPQTNPCLLHAYGAYGAFTNPIFSTHRLSLLDRGFIYAVAHVRGGADMGNAWYEEGKLSKKPNTFRDFISVAEYLCKEGYTAPEKLSIYGRSAGGLLIGAVVNMRPELFRAALTEVPFVDVINTMFDPSIPWTAFEYEEWGNPNDYDIYQVMKTYCPYTNIQGDVLRKDGYPHMLVVGGMNDPRVAFFEPLKWIAKMRYLKRTLEENKDSIRQENVSNIQTFGLKNRNGSLTKISITEGPGSNRASVTLRNGNESSNQVHGHGLKNSVFSTSEGQIILLRVDDVGHGGPSGQYSYLEDLAFEYAFLIAALEAPIQPILPPDVTTPHSQGNKNAPNPVSPSLYSSISAALLGMSGLLQTPTKKAPLSSFAEEEDSDSINEDNLKVLQKGKKKGQGLDVFEKEEYRNKTKGDRGQNRLFQ